MVLKMLKNVRERGSNPTTPIEKLESGQQLHLQKEDCYSKLHYWYIGANRRIQFAVSGNT